MPEISAITVTTATSEIIITNTVLWSQMVIIHSYWFQQGYAKHVGPENVQGTQKCRTKNTALENMFSKCGTWNIKARNKWHSVCNITWGANKQHVWDPTADAKCIWQYSTGSVRTLFCASCAHIVTMKNNCPLGTLINMVLHLVLKLSNLNSAKCRNLTLHSFSFPELSLFLYFLV